MQRAACCCLILTALCSGCARPPLVTKPMILAPEACARPKRPALPALSGLAFLESLEGYARLVARDTVLRTYIRQLEDALRCYERQCVPEVSP